MTVERPAGSARRMLAVADSDSYLKWAAGLLSQLPAGWESRLLVVNSPIAPSAAQVADAVAGTPFVGLQPVLTSPRALRSAVAGLRPDAMLLACTGPVVDGITGSVLRGVRPRPVYVTGLPGVSIPATVRAWFYRGAADLFVVHSTREVREFAAIGAMVGVGDRMALSHLPFLDAGPAPGRPAEAPVRDRVVFAAQAKVPSGREDREQILLRLAALGAARPELRVVVKLRARAGEEQTHRETDGYETLWGGLVERGRVRPGTVRFESGPMRWHLDRSVGLATVSSTAAVEAAASGVPLLILSDFGVSAKMINLVFEDSGCLGTLADLERGRFRHPRPEWCRDNYFHDPAEDDWVPRLAALVERVRAGEPLPAGSLLEGRPHRRARTAERLKLEVPPSLARAAIRANQRRRRAARRLIAMAVGAGVTRA